MPQIHIWSDYVCPFCLIADELVERAIDDQPDVQVVHHPFELRPYPTPTLRPEDDYLPTIWQRAVYPMADRHGVELHLPTVSPQPWTELAFRGFYHADDQGLGHAYHQRMMTAFFREDLDLGSRDVLARLAEQVGLERESFLRALDDDATAARHRESLAEAERMQVTVVPTLVIGSRRINGVADVGVLRRAIDEARRHAA